MNKMMSSQLHLPNFCWQYRCLRSLDDLKYNVLIIFHFSFNLYKSLGGVILIKMFSYKTFIVKFTRGLITF